MGSYKHMFIFVLLLYLFFLNTFSCVYVKNFFFFFFFYEFTPFSDTRRYKLHQSKVKVKGLGRKSSYLTGFSIFFFSWFYEKVQPVG